MASVCDDSASASASEHTVTLPSHDEVPPRATPAQEVDVTVELVAELLAGQFPELAREPLTVGPSGWDNVMVRIGSSLAARLPRRQLAADISASELDWLPRVGRAWSFSAPVPVGVGDPANGYPWRWAVVPWFEGRPEFEAQLSPDGVAEFGAALAEVHAPAPAGSPLNPFRSQPLSARAERLDARLETLSTIGGWVVETDAVRAAIEAADPWQGCTWCHLDLHGNNVLTAHGHLAAIIDWGDSGLGDPATDLGQAWYLLGSERFEAFADAYREAGGGADPSAPRVRAEALAYAVTMASLEDEVYAASGWKALRDLGVATAV